jgi:Asp/Glu/hydantoin racemase
MPTIGFLHTADVHVATFDRLVAERAPEADAVHEVRADLLDAARRHGLGDPAIETGITDSIAALERRGADVIVCTCSTISGLAERPARPTHPPVVRIDRPMAAIAVRLARRIAVVAAVESTIAPTLSLLHEEAGLAGTDVEIDSLPCFSAWPMFENGDLDGYHRLIAAHVDAVDDSYDIVVLAQATMAPAAALVVEPARVRSSPVAAVDAALAYVR